MSNSSDITHTPELHDYMRFFKYVPVISELVMVGKHSFQSFALPFNVGLSGIQKSVRCYICLSSQYKIRSG